ncbi:MAG: UbiD family decarboxylase, partial [Bacteroidota bacterium]|nr:UbiD family decarboxylase [Bacteroidota bacterium]
EISISELPQIKCWPNDGGSFITLPQVYSEDIDNPGIMNSNLGMYRIQLSGNDYNLNQEVGLHYQLHRGIGIHQAKAHKRGDPLKISIFIGGHPAHSFAAVMPLPEGITELTFAGLLSGRRFRYSIKDGYKISVDADFVICGEIYPNQLKSEGPFGDHLGYYSLKHDFPVLKVYKVYAKDDGVWPFTVVGRPPQEDSQFGKLIHEITDGVLKKEIPGLHSLNAVDAAGVHPLLLATGSERYTPFSPTKIPQELLTIANHILGTGQMSLAKYVCIVEKENAPEVNNEKAFFRFLLERVNWERDLHFYTNTTIDTLDYTGDSLHQGSKLVIAATGDIKRKLIKKVPDIKLPKGFSHPKLIDDGNLVLEGHGEIDDLISLLERQDLSGLGLITIVDNSKFTVQSFSNWLWVTFTRSNPANDIYGLDSETKNKHFSCSIPIIDARIKPHHAPILER